MNELEDTFAESRPAHTASRETRGLFVLTVGGQTFAVGAEETGGAFEGLTPAPLPHAPAAVLGVVSIRGRMHTLLYPPALFSQTDERRDTPTPRFAVALRGDEQLALAADSIEGIVTFNATFDVTFNTDSTPTSDSQDSPLAATLEHEGRSVQLLDASRLFDAAMRGTERRRTRA